MKKIKIIGEFKEFISRGNVIDLAVGVIIGSAFTKIVTSLVNDMVMPLIGILLSGVDFTTLSFNVGEASIKYGNFIQCVIDFLLVALVIFLVVKAINSLKRKKEEPVVEAEPVISEEVLLLREIRDELKNK